MRAIILIGLFSNPNAQRILFIQAYSFLTNVMSFSTG